MMHMRRTPSEDFSIELHRAVATHLREDPAEVRAIAGARIARWRARGDASARHWTSSWAELLRLPDDDLVSRLTQPSDTLVDLYQSTPFAGVLTSAERLDIWRRVFRGTRETRHAS